MNLTCMGSVHTGTSRGFIIPDSVIRMTPALRRSALIGSSAPTSRIPIQGTIGISHNVINQIRMWIS